MDLDRYREIEYHLIQIRTLLSTLLSVMITEPTSQEAIHLRNALAEVNHVEEDLQQACNAAQLVHVQE